jgi:hypothetical protein
MLTAGAGIVAAARGDRKAVGRHLGETDRKAPVAWVSAGAGAKHPLPDDLSAERGCEDAEVGADDDQLAHAPSSPRAWAAVERGTCVLGVVRVVFRVIEAGKTF